MSNEEKSASGGDEEQKDLPKPDPELPKPEDDLPLPEKEITSGGMNDPIHVFRGGEPSAQPTKSEKPHQASSELVARKFPLLKVLVFGFIAIFSLLAFGLIAYLMTYQNKALQNTETEIAVSPTPDPTADWQTYSDTELNFTLKYPNGWVSPTEAPQTIVNKEINSYVPPNDYVSLDFRIWTPDDPNYYIADKFYDTESELWINDNPPSEEGPGNESSPSKLVEYQEKMIEVVSHPTRNYESTSSDWNSYTYYILKDGKILVLTFYFNIKNPNLANVLKTKDLILSTFKFTDMSEASSVDTSSWKIYNGTVFNFKYPPEYKIETDNSNYVIIKDSNNEFVEFSTEKYDEESGFKPFNSEEFIISKITIKCSADGPAGSNYCNKAISKTEFSTTKGNTGYKYILNLVEENYLNNSKQVNDKAFGPIYVFKVTDPKIIYTVSTSYNNNPAEQNSFNDLLDSIASTVSIN